MQETSNTHTSQNPKNLILSKNGRGKITNKKKSLKEVPKMADMDFMITNKTWRVIFQSARDKRSRERDIFSRWIFQPHVLTSPCLLEPPCNLGT